MNNNFQEPKQIRLTFGDAFAGCGGLSLGLIKAGWQGLFAIEKNSDAFETLKTNLISDQYKGFDWPEWLPTVPIDVLDFVNQYDDYLRKFKGELTLLAGGPPCQGFSMAGDGPATRPLSS